MHCPFCGALDTKVIDSRLAEDGAAIKRRRRCVTCTARFTTFERLEELPLTVVKSTGDRQPFDRAKIARGISRAATGRPISEEQIDAVVADVEEAIRMVGPEVTSSDIGIAVLDALAAIDQVAYLRFASVYKNFDDADDFRRELSLLSKRPVSG
ncbi:MAG: transcriptional regulator NrdR [Acidimicrobiia bacterium]